MAEAVKDFYHSPKWERIRAKILRRDKYLDQYAKRFGRMKEAEVVHHIFPRSDFPQYQYETWNLISLSRETHNRMHDKTNDELSDAGIELLRRTARKYGRSVPEKYR